MQAGLFHFSTACQIVHMHPAGALVTGCRTHLAAARVKLKGDTAMDSLKRVKHKQGRLQCVTRCYETPKWPT